MRSPVQFRTVASLQIVACLAVLTLVPASADAATSTPRESEWPRFRGPNADGISAEGAVFSDLEEFGLEVAWKVPIGGGYSGVTVAGGYAVTMFSDGESDVAIAFDANDGKELWRFVVGPTHHGHDGSHTGPISTPIIAGKRVFGLGPSGRLFALNVESGQPIWSTDLVKDHGAKGPWYGFGTSPILQDGVLVLGLGGEDAAFAGFDPESGERLWTAGSDTIQYQSPIPLALDGRRHVLAPGDKYLLGIDPGTGEILWQYAHEGTGEYGIASLVPVAAGDGRLFLAYKDEASALVELGRKEDAVAVERTWESRSIRNSYSVPVYYRGHLYAFSSRFLTCVDAATGESVWRSRKPGDGFPILVDGHLVIVTKEGSVHVAKASPEGYQEVAHLSLFDDLAWTPPSFANGRIYVRSHGEIARVDIRRGVTLAETASGPAEAVAGSRFARFLAEVRSATDKKAVVDRFMASYKRFPLIEGDDRVHFVYRGSADDMAIAGEMIGTRQEKPMTGVEGSDLFYYSTRLEPDARVNYLFIKDYEEITDPLNPRKTTTTILGKGMEMTLGGEEMGVAMPKWKPPAHLGEPEASRRGRIETRELESKHLEAKHAIDVYLPAGYEDGDRGYPVAYVHGGGPARERGQLTTMLDNLIGKSVEPVIVVFINHMPEFFQTEKYAAMVAEELIPFVDGSYRTIASPGARANVGAGFSGYHAIYCAFKHPGLVGKVASQSTFLLDTMLQWLEAMVSTSEEQPLQFYLEWGKYDLKNPHESWSIPGINQRLVRLLRERGYSPAGGEVHDGTGWASWRNRTDVVFETLFPVGP